MSNVSFDTNQSQAEIKLIERTDWNADENSHLGLGEMRKTAF